jgi:metal-responsive CopG/Arc/MetJ family transcriptional regulator
MKERKQMQRGAVRTSESIFVGVWLPFPLVRALDEAVQVRDSDRSKIIRNALTEKMRTS